MVMAIDSSGLHLLLAPSTPRDDEDRYESAIVPYGTIQSWCRTVPYKYGMVPVGTRVQYMQKLYKYRYPSMCRICCRFQLKDSQALGMGGLAAEGLCLLPMMHMLGYTGPENSCLQFVCPFTNSGNILLAQFVNQTTRVLHAFYSAHHASASLCLSPPAGGSFWRDTQGTRAGRFPFERWRGGMIMEMRDQDLALQNFRYNNNPNCNWEVRGSYKLQLDSASALSIPSSPSAWGFLAVLCNGLHPSIFIWHVFL